MRARIVGIAIFLLIVAGALVWQFALRGGSGGAGGDGEGRETPKPVVTLTGLVGGEKQGFVDDPLVRERLRRRYRLALDATRAGSIEMVRDETQDQDFLWPSSQIALELYKSEKGSPEKSAIVFNSPIVIYSWDIVADALVEQGVVEKRGQTYYLNDLRKLIDWVLEGRTWVSIGLPQLYGKISVDCTDPTKSNSGLMFAGLLANVLSGGVANEGSLPGILPKIERYFTNLGFTESSSGTLFEQYLTLGVGGKPLVVGYESQAIEFSLQEPELWARIKDKVRVLYPVPTVWSAHPLMALDKQAVPLVDALLDGEFQLLAWERHGFRSGPAGTQNDPAGLAVPGVPKEILQVVPIPSAPVMESIIGALEARAAQ